MLVLIATYYTRLSRVMLFWVAFVLTRPFGATFGDLLTKPIAKGGLDFGTLGSSLVLASLLVTFMIYTSMMSKRPATRAVARGVGGLGGVAAGDESKASSQLDPRRQRHLRPALRLRIDSPRVGMYDTDQSVL